MAQYLPSIFESNYPPLYDTRLEAFIRAKGQVRRLDKLPETRLVSRLTRGVLIETVCCEDERKRENKIKAAKRENLKLNLTNKPVFGFWMFSLATSILSFNLFLGDDFVPVLRLLRQEYTRQTHASDVLSIKPVDRLLPPHFLPGTSSQSPWCAQLYSWLQQVTLAIESKLR